MAVSVFAFELCESFHQEPGWDLTKGRVSPLPDGRSTAHLQSCLNLQLPGVFAAVVTFAVPQPSNAWLFPSREGLNLPLVFIRPPRALAE